MKELSGNNTSIKLVQKYTIEGWKVQAVLEARGVRDEKIVDEKKYWGLATDGSTELTNNEESN